MNQNLSELDCAVKYLRQHGARRDAAAGQWMLSDGIALGANPIEAARSLRASLIQKSIDNARNSGRYMTR
ncbi:MAG TPA: hypothetical protein P5102_02855 [Candidatus Competibacteraceae bacterium]|nr:hypothetical protein [Candidatus Competibacteraceae bacterium]HRZ05085.1 hypothetical protein [Candidatus Competibacteraceae bacterium]HSA48121.1 hypothetical protein [Candidatus Competibacteraceae bacterium]